MDLSRVITDWNSEIFVADSYRGHLSIFNQHLFMTSLCLVIQYEQLSVW